MDSCVDNIFFLLFFSPLYVCVWGWGWVFMCGGVCTGEVLVERHIRAKKTEVVAEKEFNEALKGNKSEFFT